MLVVEYSGILDWLKQKTGIGYTAIRTLPENTENKMILKEILTIMKAKGIDSYVKCENNVCILFVDTDKLSEAMDILSEYSASKKHIEEVKKGISKNAILVSLATIPLVLMMGMRK